MLGQFPSKIAGQFASAQSSYKLLRCEHETAAAANNKWFMKQKVGRCRNASCEVLVTAAITEGENSHVLLSS